MDLAEFRALLARLANISIVLVASLGLVTSVASAQESDDDALSDEQGKAIINALQNELESAKDQVARAMAETENTRRRARKEREDASKYAISNFAKDLLDVSDNLRRALEALPTDLLEAEPRLKNVMDGVEATERTLLKNFEKHHITKIEPLDEPFNPNFHEVMFESPVPGKPAGIIMQVLEPGYILHDPATIFDQLAMAIDHSYTNQAIARSTCKNATGT